MTVKLNVTKRVRRVTMYLGCSQTVHGHEDVFHPDDSLDMPLQGDNSGEVETYEKRISS